VFRDAVRAMRAVQCFVTLAVSAPRAVRAVCAVRFFVTPLSHGSPYLRIGYRQRG